MVKIKFEIYQKNDEPQKRIRGLKPNSKKENQHKNKNREHQENYEPNYQKENGFLFSDGKNYSPKIRYIVLFRLLKLIEQINEQIKLPDNFIFSTIALFDSYLSTSTEYVYPKEMELALYACLDILDKEQNISVFTNSYFKKYIDVELEFDILEVVDLEVYPQKLYDYFDKFYYELLKSYGHSEKILNILSIFKKKFLNNCFLTMFNFNSLDKKPFTNYLFCLFLTYEKTKDIIPEEAHFLKEKFKEMMYINKNLATEFSNFKELINESINIFNNLLYQIR